MNLLIKCELQSAIILLVWGLTVGAIDRRRFEKSDAAPKVSVDFLRSWHDDVGMKVRKVKYGGMEVYLHNS
jgi:hypothetical protein